MVKRIISWFDENSEEGHCTYHGDFDDEHAVEYMNERLEDGCTQIELYEIIPTKLIKAKKQIKKINIVKVDNMENKPCVRCGYCCKKSTCPLGIQFDSPSTNCSFLGGNKIGEHYCRFVTENLVPDAKTMVAIGEGCCSPLNSDRNKAELR